MQFGLSQVLAKTTGASKSAFKYKFQSSSVDIRSWSKAERLVHRLVIIRVARVAEPALRHKVMRILEVTLRAICDMLGH